MTDGATRLDRYLTDLRATIAPLTRILLQSIGADPRPR